MCLFPKNEAINTSDRPKMSLNSIPPQSASKNIFSDLFTLNFISKNPIAKFIIESIAPSKIDLKTMPDKFNERNDIVTRRSARNETTKQKLGAAFHFLSFPAFRTDLMKVYIPAKTPRNAKYYC